MRKYLVNSFAYGEISPTLTGRIDAAYYKQSCKTMKNAFPLASGPAKKRPGTYYAGVIPTSDSRTLIPFALSATEGRILCFYFITVGADCYFKVCKLGTDGTPEFVQFSGSDYIKTISLSDPVGSYGDLAKFMYAQDSTTELFDTLFIVSTGILMMSASVYTYPNPISGIHVIRTSDTSWATDNEPEIAGSDAHIFQDRMVVTVNNSVIISESNDHDDFTIPSPAVAESPITFDLNPDKIPLIQWGFGENTLFLGTPSGIYRVAGADDPLDGTAITVGTLQCSTGCADVKPVMLDDSLVFVQKSGKRVHTLQYDSDVEKYVSTDITFLSDHIIDGKIIQLAIQKEPETTLWAVTDTGKLLAMSYSRQMGTAGWSEIDVGGEVESVAIIPGTDEDHVFIIVKRTIGGAEVRYVEMFATREHDGFENGHYVDSGILWDGGDAVVVTSITAASPAVCTATSHGIADDSKVMFEGVTGITLVNGRVYTVKNGTTHTFELYDEAGTTAIDFSGEAAAGAGGTVKIVTNTVTGLTHLEGEEVQILGDGSVITPETVSGGSITMDQYANKIHVGLAYEMVVEPLDIAEGPGSVKQIKNLYAKFYGTPVMKYGKDVDHLREVTLLDGAPTMDTLPEVATANIKELVEGEYDYEGSVVFVSDVPLPFMLISVISELEVIK